MAGINLALLSTLADGEWHSGSALGAASGKSRAAVWKEIRRLRELGLVIHGARGQGYRLAARLELLDPDRVRAELAAPALAALQALRIEPVLPSTSEALRAAAAPPSGRFTACLAEYQSGGRGRRGRRWLSPFGSGLCLSMAWRFEAPPPGLACLSLAAGVAVVEAVISVADTSLGLKWPNDIVAVGRKLGGLLVDIEGETDGPLKAVIGVGLNLTSTPSVAAVSAESPGALGPVSLLELLGPGLPSRNRVAAAVLSALHRALTDFARDGFTPFADRWRRLDCLYGSEVRVTAPAGHLDGVARGITPDGGLIVEAAGELRTVFSGDVSIRPAP